MEDEINILDYYSVIKKRWLWLFLLCAVSASVSLYKGFHSPKIYKAETNIYVFTSSGRLMAQVPQSLLNLVGGGAGTGSQTDYLEKLLTSDDLALKVAEKLKLHRVKGFMKKEVPQSKSKSKQGEKKDDKEKNNPQKKFEYDLKNHVAQKLVFNLKEQVVIKNDKKGSISISCEAKNPKLAATLANTFVEVLRSKITSKSKINVDFLKKQLEKVKSDLAAAENNLKAFQQENKIMALDRELEGKVNKYLNMKSEQLQNKMMMEATRKLMESSGSLEDLAKLEGDKILYETKQTEMDGALQQMDTDLLTYPNKSQQYARLLRELKLQSLSFEFFSQQYEMERISQLRDDVYFQIIDRAYPPEKHIKPRKRKMVMMAVGASLIGGIFFIFFLEFVEGTKKSESAKSKEVPI